MPLAFSASCLTNLSPKLVNEPSAHVDHALRTSTYEEVCFESFSPSYRLYSKILNFLSPFADSRRHSFGRLYCSPPRTSIDHASDSWQHFSAPVSRLAYTPIGACAIRWESLIRSEFRTSSGHSYGTKHYSRSPGSSSFKPRHHPHLSPLARAYCLP